VSNEVTIRKRGGQSDFKPEYCEQAFKLCLLGAKDEEIAHFFEVTEMTINRWKNAYPAFKLSLKDGKKEADTTVAQSLYHRAIGQFVKIEKMVYDAETKKHGKVTLSVQTPADVTAQIFWLKNRRPDLWRDVHKHEHGKAGDFDRMSDKELHDKAAIELEELGMTDLAKQMRERGTLEGNDTVN
jgi:hypothetical protein